MTEITAEASHHHRSRSSRPSAAFIARSRHANGMRHTSGRLQAAQANVRRLLLTHLWPGTDHAAVLAEAGTTYDGQIGIAHAGLVVDLS